MIALERNTAGLVAQAVVLQAEAQRRESKSRTWQGAQYADARATMRGRADTLEAEASSIRMQLRASRVPPHVMVAAL